jgi:hypothetical protein
VGWLFGKVEMPFTKHIAYLRLEIPMYVPELVQLADGRKHFADIKSCMFLLEYARIV